MNFFQSYLNGYVIDVQGGKPVQTSANGTVTGTPLDAYPMNYNPYSANPPSQQQLNSGLNQLWKLVPGPIQNSFFIQSMLSPGNSVIDITGNGGAGTSLQIYPMKPVSTPAQIESAKNQLWTIVPVTATPPPVPPPGVSFAITYYWIQSVMDSNLVIDIRGGSKQADTPLQVWTKNAPSTPTVSWDQFTAASNQLWVQIPYYIRSQ